jgi:hypothetical protein
MYTTFQTTSTIDFESLVGKYICFLSKDSKTLKETIGRYVTNCNYVYKVVRVTSCFLLVEEDFHGQVRNTKLRKDTFEDGFFKGHYVICDTKPSWGIKVGTYEIDIPDYKFDSTTDLNKSFTTDEINQLLHKEFIGTTKGYGEVLNCFETLCDVLMKRHFDYVTVGSGYFQGTNLIHIGLDIHSGYKYFGCFGQIDIKSYRNKINYIEFKQSDRINRNTGFEGFVWSDLESFICKYLKDNQEYIDTL